MQLVIAASFAAMLVSRALAADERPQVPTLSAVNFQTGNVISRSGDSRIIGTAAYSQDSTKTTRIVAVKVQVRSSSKPKAPYEVQCFFTATDPAHKRYIYDAVKTPSDKQWDELVVYARDLFGGSQTVEQGTVTTQTATETLTTSVILTTTVPGARLEGWIVRVISGGHVVRLEASLHNLKDFAEKEAALLDKIAAEIKQAP